MQLAISETLFSGFNVPKILCFLVIIIVIIHEILNQYRYLQSKHLISYNYINSMVELNSNTIISNLWVNV